MTELPELQNHLQTRSRPASVELNEQPASCGVGPKYHRRYSIEFSATPEQALAIMNKLQTEIDSFSPQWMAAFEKRKGGKALLVNDEFDVLLSAPWEAPVKVKAVAEDGFVLATLEGHLEAGEIRFRVCEVRPGRARFEIESYARSKDRLVDFLYDKIPVARFAQSAMWSEFCQNFAGEVVKLTGRKNDCSEVSILTERQDEKTGRWERL